METKPLTIELEIGYTEKGVTHRSVTFGKRLTGKELFIVDSDPRGGISTQYQHLLLRNAITEFGTLTMPIDMMVFQKMDSIDTDDLNTGFTKFQEGMLEGRGPEFLEGDRVKLAFGLEREGMVYDLVEFGRRLTGMDEIQADKKGYRVGTIQRVCYLAGRQVRRLAQSEGDLELPGEMEIETFRSLDVVDIQAIRLGAELFRQSFRRAGTRLRAERPGLDGASDSKKHGVERAVDTGSVN
ncbi:MAG TPA: hypothetical protein VI756_32565 [Blastocatellia bacterium]